MPTIQALLHGPVPGTHSRRWPPLTIAAIVCAFISPLLIGAACVAAVETEHFGWRTGMAVFAATGSLLTALGVVLTATRLHASGELYRTIVETASDGIFIADAQGRFTFVNDRLAEMLARPREELLGHPGFDFIAKSDRADVDETFRSRRSGLMRAQHEIRFTRPNGSERFVIATTTTLLGTTRRFSGIVGTITDITNRVNAENELRKLYEENDAAHRSLQRAHESLRARVDTADTATIEDLAERLASANQELETFTYSVSHDLRAPLRTIAGFAHELLLDYKNVVDARGLHYLERISAAAGRMTALIDDLLTFSRTARDTLQRHNVDLTSCAREVAAELLDRNGGRTIEIDIEDGLSARADGRLMRIVFTNLLGNAIKFTGQREVARIRVHRLLRDGNEFIAVTDNGAGFDPAFASQLFTPFQRLHRTSEFEGNGIGLAIVHRVVHRHGGITWADAVPGEGATFAFSLGVAA